MLPHIIRKQPLDLDWGAAELDAAAEFWLRLYEEAARASRFAATPRHATEIRLRGFPKAQADALTRELARRAAASDFLRPEVGPHDPDTLVLSSDLTGGEDAPPVGLGVPLLAGPEFDGLCAEVRFRVVGDEGRLFRRVQIGSTLVLFGELRGGRLLVRAVWRSGGHGWEDELCWAALWPEQDAWLKALDEFRQAAEVPRRLAGKVFVGKAAERGGSLAVWLIHVPRDGPRLGGLLLRAAIFAGLLAAFAGGIAWAVSNERWIGLALVLFAGWWVVWLFGVFVKKEYRLFVGGYRQFRTRYAKLYEDSVRFAPLTRAEGDAEADNAYARKHVADLEAAGFAHAGDLRIVGGSAGRSVVRVFRCPDGVSYLNVLVMLETHADPEKGFRTWPANVAVLAHTYYADGGRAVSLSGRGGGYRKKRSGPEVRARVFPGVDDPAEFARLHMGLAAEFAEETGRRPVPHERFELYLRRQEQLHEEERQRYLEHPYSWGDHLHQYLRRTRREYRG